MDAATWVRVGTLFDELSERPPGQRDLEALDLPGPVRALLDRMLTAHDTGDDQLLDRTLGGLAGELFDPADADDAMPADLAGQDFGNWRADEEIGRGGMSVVALGHRADGHFEKRVAIKIMPPGTGGGIHRERLLEEIRILARLEHPGIARLIDGGISGDGYPYLVMEYVDGEPITAYCERNGLDIEARVRLFCRAVDAVAYAHRHLIVHCDIKPGNVLVTADGQVKLVDFGIAALIGQGRDEAPRGVFCSPGYAAPEQMSGAKPATAQDVFGLGALLYRLLCGQRVRSVGSFTRLTVSADPDETVRPPSSHRSGRAARRLRGDPDAICKRALEADPDARYATANALRQDLNRWLRSEPVHARDGGAVYLMGRWFVRRRWLAAGGALVAASLVAGISVALWQAERARAEASLAGSVQTFLLDMFGAVDPWRNRQSPVTADELVDRAVDDLPERLDAHPAQKAEILHALGQILRRMGRAEEALAIHRQSVGLWRELDATGQVHRGLIAMSQDALDSFQREGIADWLDEIIAETRWPPQTDAAVDARLIRIKLLTLRGEHDEQRRLVDEVLASREAIRALPEGERLLAETYVMAAEATENVADYEQAVEHARRAAELFTVLHGPDHPNVGQAVSYEATARHLEGRYDEAMDAIDRVLEIDRGHYGEVHPQTLWTRYTRSRILSDAGRHRDAIEAYERIVSDLTTLFGPEDPRLAVTYANLGKSWRSLGDLDRAVEYFARGLPIIRDNEPEHPKYGTYLAQYGQALSEAGRTDQAGEFFRQSLELLTAKLGRDHPVHANARIARAQHQLRTGRVDTALAEAEAGLEVLDTHLDPTSPQLAEAHRTLADAHNAGGHDSRARHHWQEALAILTVARYRNAHEREIAALNARLDEGAN